MALEDRQDLRRPDGLGGIVPVDWRSKSFFTSDPGGQGKVDAVCCGDRFGCPFSTGGTDVLVEIEQAARAEGGRGGGEAAFEVFHVMQGLVCEDGVEGLP